MGGQPAVTQVDPLGDDPQRDYLEEEVKEDLEIGDERQKGMLDGPTESDDEDRLPGAPAGISRPSFFLSRPIKLSMRRPSRRVNQTNHARQPTSTRSPVTCHQVVPAFKGSGLRRARKAKTERPAITRSGPDQVRRPAEARAWITALELARDGSISLAGERAI